MAVVTRASFLCLVFSALPLCAQENPRHISLGPGLTEAKTLSQNWSDEESNWFYNVPQGSRLMPYEWFLHLEQPQSQDRFLDASHIRGLGYIARLASTDNPDGLPIGFVKDSAYDDGTPGLGLTCAACHTSQIDHQGVAYIVDGGPTLGDMQTLMSRLANALEATAAEDAKFERFAAKVLTSDFSESNKSSLRSALHSNAIARSAYNHRNFPKQASLHYGHGRVDAFGAIFNEVAVTFLGVSENVQEASAPVSYPCLWDAPQHDRVQWNGAAQNRTSKLGKLLFGTEKVGALGRNSGEVLGVFGHAVINTDEVLVPRPYTSTVNKANLLKIEDSLETLWSPVWPDGFGKIDDARRTRGEAIFNTNCSACHRSIDRTSPTRAVKAVITDEGTDPTMVMNFGRTAKTGKLEGRRVTIQGQDDFGPSAPIGLILKHVVERVMLNPISGEEVKVLIASKLNNVNGLNPGYQNTAIIRLRGRELSVSLDSLSIGIDSIRFRANKSELLGLASEVRAKLTEDADSGNPFKTLKAARERVGHLLDLSNTDESEASSVIEVRNASASFGYKARPLNGVWSTAPYLHNGSVPTLAELLKPASRRVVTFHVGSLEFDPVNVGFISDPAFPVYDTKVTGNHNTGHEHGSQLAENEKLDLIEYLKSL